MLRLKFPKGYAIPPHTHPKPEIVTVISGTFTLGMGNVPDKSNAKPLPAGSFFAFEPGMAHYAFTDEETVVQINSTGPWGINFPKMTPDRKRSDKNSGWQRTPPPISLRRSCTPGRNAMA